MRDKHLDYIKTIFCCLHSNFTNIPCPNSIYKKYLSVTLHGKRFLATGKKAKLYVALAYWDRTIFGAPPTSIMSQFDINSSLHLVKIHHYALVTFSIEGEVFDLPLAVCSWYFPYVGINNIGKLVKIWNADTFESPNIYCLFQFTSLKNVVPILEPLSMMNIFFRLFHL